MRYLIIGFLIGYITSIWGTEVVIMDYSDIDYDELTVYSPNSTNQETDLYPCKFFPDNY